MQKRGRNFLCQLERGPPGIERFARRCTGNAVLGWNDNLVYSEELSNVAWEVKKFGLAFKVAKKDGEVETFQYMTLKRQPWRLLTELFIPDDEWDLEGDLPHFAYTRLSSRR